MTPAEAAAKLDAITAEPGRDNELKHIKADNILIAMVPDEVREAYYRLTNKVDLWFA